MKKIIMLALVLTTIAGTAFSRNTDANNQKVLSSFNKTFANAEDVHWEVDKDFYKATFRINDQIMFAYYNNEGEQIALSRNIKINQLPLNLASDLQSNYKELWLTDLFEMVINNESAYYATVHSATHITILKADGVNSWSVFKKSKK